MMMMMNEAGGLLKMRKKRNHWIKIIILILIVGWMNWLGTARGVKAEPNNKTSASPQTSTPPQSPVVPTPKVPIPSQPIAPATAQPSVPAAPAPQTPTAPIVPPPPSAPPGKSVPSRTGSAVVFNFDNADLYEVIRVMGEILKISYIIDPRVKGVVNIHTSGQIAAEEAFPIFQSILRLNGATAVKKDGAYEIVPLTEAKKLPISPTMREPGKPSEEKYTIEIISLKYIPVTEVSKIIKPFLSDGADIVEHPPHNILILGDLASNVRKSLDIINLFDMDIFSGLRVRIYPIVNADVSEVAKEMERIFSSFEVSTKSGRGVGITFTPITRINSLLVVSSIPEIFEKVEGWLRELDKIPGEGSKLSVFVYYVQNAKAKDLAEVLKEIYGKVKEKKPGEAKERGAVPAEAPARGMRAASTPAAPVVAAKEEAAGVPEGEINIVVDETTNALIIKAFQRDYTSIVETIKKLDIYPKQVLIEVLLAEITLNDSNNFGIEWARFLSSNPPNAQEVLLQSRPPTDPFSQALSAANIRYSIVELGGRVAAAISAAASTNRLNVVSSPHIIASNNKEAKIQIGKSQPILTSTYSYGTTTGTTTPSTGVIEGTIEYKDIGVILTVTPRISDGGLITLEIQVEKSDVSLSALGSLPNVPVFDKKTAKTILSVLQGQMIIIGGLIEDSKTRNKSGVPLLHKIPILGALFGTQTYSNDKTELLLLMIPHIITDHIQSKTVTDEFRDKVEGLKKELEKERTKKEE
jgi:general secretion pathway protein D